MSSEPGLVRFDPVVEIRVVSDCLCGWTGSTILSLGLTEPQQGPVHQHQGSKQGLVTTSGSPPGTYLAKQRIGEMTICLELNRDIIFKKMLLMDAS